MAFYHISSCWWLLLWMRMIWIHPKVAQGWSIAPKKFLFAKTSCSLYASFQSEDDDRPSYELGVGKNAPVGHNTTTTTTADMENEPLAKGDESSPPPLFWVAPTPVHKPIPPSPLPTTTTTTITSTSIPPDNENTLLRTTRKVVPRTEDGRLLKNALWHEDHFFEESPSQPENQQEEDQNCQDSSNAPGSPPMPSHFYPDIDLSVSQDVYSVENNIDLVWDLMRWEAFQEAQREPLLVSFLYSSILNHKSLESSLAFYLANRLDSPSMISTQIQSLILQAFEYDPTISQCLRADMLAVRDRDPACNALPDVFLYFKGFHALQTYRVAHALWKAGKHVLGHYLQSQMSQVFQIDIHPNATLGSGIMLDHGTGIVIGETARVGHNCSILHHVTLGGSGKKGVDRHPKIGDGVLLGAGASVLGNVKIGDGCQVGAGTLVITDLPAHCVAVGVPARIIGSFVDVTQQPSIGMNQNVMDPTTAQSDTIFLSEGI